MGQKFVEHCFRTVSYSTFPRIVSSLLVVKELPLGTRSEQKINKKMKVRERGNKKMKVSEKEQEDESERERK